MKLTLEKKDRRLRRQRSTRRRLSTKGPSIRLTVVRSSKHISAQIIDDRKGVTVCGLGSTAKRFAGDFEGKSKTERAAIIGTEIARLAMEKGIDTVVFDRGFNKYHGRVKALAEAAREAGLKF